MKIVEQTPLKIAHKSGCDVLLEVSHHSDFYPITLENTMKHLNASLDNPQFPKDSGLLPNNLPNRDLEYCLIGHCMLIVDVNNLFTKAIHTSLPLLNTY